MVTCFYSIKSKICVGNLKTFIFFRIFKTKTKIFNNFNKKHLKTKINTTKIKKKDLITNWKLLNKNLNSLGKTPLANIVCILLKLRKFREVL